MVFSGGERQPELLAIPYISKVVEMNVLSYFTILDTGAPIYGPSGNLDWREANSAAEFTRQRNKLIAAIDMMNADILGPTEIEYKATTDIQNLVDGLKSFAGSSVYAFINTGTIGTDAIKVALIYKPARVTPINPFAILESTVDSNFIDTKYRPSLAQTFQMKSRKAIRCGNGR